jgi:hypothetical protein
MTIADNSPLSPPAPTVSENARNLLGVVIENPYSYAAAAALLSYIATLELDARRLDFMEGKHLDHDSAGWTIAWRNEVGHSIKHYCAQSKNLRESIDSAMESK